MAAEDIGSLYNTKVPGYEDAADIQAAFKLFLYGSSSYDETNTDPTQLPNPSLARHLQDLADNITALDERGIGSIYSATEPTSPVDGLIWVDSDAVPTNISSGNSVYVDYQNTNDFSQNVADLASLKYSDGTTDLVGIISVTTGFSKVLVELTGNIQTSTATDEEAYIMLQRSTDNGVTWVDVKNLQVSALEEENAILQNIYQPFTRKVLDTHGVSAGSSVQYRFVNNTAAVIGGSPNTIRQFFTDVSSLLILKEVA